MGRYSFNQSQREALELEGLLFTEEEAELDTLMRDRIMGEITKQKERNMEIHLRELREEQDRKNRDREANFPDLGSW